MPGKNFEFNLRGHTALITGGSRRIGRALCLDLAGCGVAVACHFNRSRDEAAEVVRECRSMGVKAAAVQADLEDGFQVEGLIAAARRELGTVHILINNASIFTKKPALETDTALWQSHMDVNLKAPVMLSRNLALQDDLHQGVIINILDWRGLRPDPDHFAYTISKAGLAAATENLAVALAPRIRGNGVAPGAILPPPGRTTKSPHIIEDVPMQRWSDPHELCRAVRFLLSGAGYTTGEILHVDGGRNLL